ncbi:M20/M25/M40 family metallo-hydrolase [bacterium]|nr:M20/M25/M40 family metallo-hydrolase [bacterium]
MSCREILRKLTSVRGVSGHEQEVAAVFCELTSPYAERLRTDVLGSVSGSVNSGGSPRILLECHLDEVGYIVRYISPDGLIYLQPSGTQSLDAAIAQRALVKTEHGPVYGVIGTKPRHLLSAQELTQKPGITEIWLDIGAGSAEEVRQRVDLGDPVSLVSEFYDLGARVSAPALDNRAGMTAVVESAAQLSGEKLKAEVSFLAAVQEEIGMRGAEAASVKLCPDIALVLDVCHTSDTPGIDKRVLGDVRLGGGPVLVRGPNTDYKTFRRLKDAAAEADIPVQIQASAGVTSTDAAFMQVSGGGTASGIIALPIRYMHTPNEILEWNDLENAVKLIKQFILSFN